ncbi:DNA-binding LacI/PurR family transcriptional regulator [Thermosporothrix hazakensis]|jgi:LacI family transcriptional regulator|uniref:DNA-binding LacI/PurR family transcriptional regulator n=1 Tax=Thermosporothrix hazakensis TaxID=644383 RepID=A0A326UB40_THEHA|nr:LacI family DNA-binding transcriptional regulator [Thermosporothrix hazakensis]PZW34431.1 DNA-binding LacI/PurR family transcriptional regulator [Thermosporothrix hazakensis]GCE46020.1 LacI family transcriptional regulator [Thermosporothrix hazakensis]
MEKKQQTPVKKPLTSADVARKAGVSRATVSYVLNNVQNNHVSEETRAKVLRVAQELGYQLHSSAQALRKGYSNEICIMHDLQTSVNDAEIQFYMQQNIQRMGYVPVHYYMGGLSEERRKELLLQICARRPAALFVMPGCITEDGIEQARRMGIQHIVLLTAEEIGKDTFRLPTVSLPTREMGYLAGRHLLELGHRRLAIVKPFQERHIPAFEHRLEGMKRAIAESGKEGISLEVFSLHMEMQEAHDLIDTRFQQEDRPTGIYTFNDEYALPLLAALLDRGFRIPQDVALVGTDDVFFSRFVRPALTTIRFNNAAIGEHATEIAAKLIQGEPIPETLTQPLTVELIRRSST